MNSNGLIIFIIVLLIGVGGYYLFTREPSTDEVATEQDQNPTTGNTTTPNTTTPGQNTSSDRTDVVNLAENSQGNKALVTDAKLSKRGYVVVYRVNSNSDSEILGHSVLLNAGTHAGLEIDLTQPIVNEQTLVAVLHEDDGDGKFEFPNSDFYLGNATERVVMNADIVGVTGAGEQTLLREQVDVFLENAYSSTSLYTL